MQPTLNLRKYPQDDQTVHIRFGSYTYNREYFAMGYPQPDSKVVTYNSNYDGSKTLFDNPIWHYDNTTFDLYTSSSGFINAIYHVHFTRIGSGIITRLVLPITLLLVLAALTFWAPMENRVDSTITILLSVSALYIVILANIPLLGYLTSIDKYVFWVSSITFPPFSSFSLTPSSLTLIILITLLSFSSLSHHHPLTELSPFLPLFLTLFTPPFTSPLIL
jgi:hypothetical protein